VISFPVLRFPYVTKREILQHPSVIAFMHIRPVKVAAKLERNMQAGASPFDELLLISRVYGLISKCLEHLYHYFKVMSSKRVCDFQIS
jgi:hypothetical protein